MRYRDSIQTLKHTLCRIFDIRSTRGFRCFLRMLLLAVFPLYVPYKYRWGDATAVAQEPVIESRASSNHTNVWTAGNRYWRFVSIPGGRDWAREREKRMPASANRGRRIHDLIKINMTRSRPLATDRTRGSHGCDLNNAAGTVSRDANTRGFPSKMSRGSRDSNASTRSHYLVVTKSYFMIILITWNYRIGFCVDATRPDRRLNANCSHVKWRYPGKL